MSEKLPDLPISHSEPGRRRRMLWPTGIVVSSLLAAFGVVYLLSLPVPPI